MKRRVILGVGTALTMPLWAQERDALAEIRSRLSNTALLRGQFEQRKTVKGFKQPLLSRGDFLVQRGRGVIWRTLEPLASSLILTRDRLVSRGADGTVQQQLDAAREPAVRGITELMFAVLSADLAVLAQRFSVSPHLKTAEAWQMTLLPKDASLAQWATRVEIEGDKQVRQVQWQDGLGDMSRIRMSGHLSSPALSKDEEAWLA
ncbi:LolA family protein [Ideonella paludis]|uniref:Outer membrane lipoprotein carrier protein LolA n=1 Tax=Ideonella paludis TaxID=1233411 RepID=A0ABS5DS38_9BURK|nr:outer membrane lipoprotein carrier protein LolA [Ideonella paludis]MBQ0933971.1 outer membrane lipoprotein carrier protein LolA [Ideonella paludis]